MRRRIFSCELYRDQRTDNQRKNSWKKWVAERQFIFVLAEIELEFDFFFSISFFFVTTIQHCMYHNTQTSVGLLARQTESKQKNINRNFYFSFSLPLSFSSLGEFFYLILFCHFLCVQKREENMRTLHIADGMNTNTKLQLYYTNILE